MKKTKIEKGSFLRISFYFNLSSFCSPQRERLYIYVVMWLVVDQRKAWERSNTERLALFEKERLALFEKSLEDIYTIRHFNLRNMRCNFIAASDVEQFLGKKWLLALIGNIHFFIYAILIIHSK